MERPGRVISPAADGTIRVPERPRRRRRRRALTVVVVVVVVATGLAVLAALTAPRTVGDPGAREEPVFHRPTGGAPVRVSDVTSAWGLDGLDVEGGDPMAGGAAVADLDDDGDLDLVVADGRAALLLWNGRGYDPPVDLGVDDAVGVAVGFVDADRHADIVLARAGEHDRIVWGGGGPADRATTDLARPGATAALVPVDIVGGDHVDELVGAGRSGPDLVWTSDGRRGDFASTVLPDSGGVSLTVAVADVDDDGLADLWIGRDTGYLTGANAVYSRRGVPDGPWLDIADDLGAALEIDTMGIAIADLDGDGRPDSYLSDIGDNEVLLATDGGFEPRDGTGAARIRPPGTGDGIVSSSWAAGPLDLDLDGRLDLVVVGGGFPDGHVINKIPGTEVALTEPPALLVGLGGGRYRDAWPDTELPLEVVGRGLAIGDLDGDGDDDFVVVTVDGRVHALRNDATGPTVTAEIAPSCGPAVTLQITTGDRAFTVVEPQFTFGGMHARAVTVGTGSQPVTLRVSRGSELLEERSVDGDGRIRVMLTCSGPAP